MGMQSIGRATQHNSGCYVKTYFVTSFQRGYPVHPKCFRGPPYTPTHHTHSWERFWVLDIGTRSNTIANILHLRCLVVMSSKITGTRSKYTNPFSPPASLSRFLQAMLLINFWIPQMAWIVLAKQIEVDNLYLEIHPLAM